MPCCCAGLVWWCADPAHPCTSYPHTPSLLPSLALAALHGPRRCVCVRMCVCWLNSFTHHALLAGLHAQAERLVKRPTGRPSRSMSLRHTCTWLSQNACIFLAWWCLRRLVELAGSERADLQKAVVLLVFGAGVSLSIPFAMGSIIDVVIAKPSDPQQSAEMQAKYTCLN